MSVVIDRCMHAVAVLGVADLLVDGPRPVEELAEESGAHAPSLYRILRALAAEGIFTEVGSGRFALTPPAEVLVSGRPGSMRASAIDHPRRWAAWGAMAHTARTGQPAFAHVHGMGYFEWLASDQEASAWFNQAMEGAAGRINQAVVEAYDFSGVRAVVDVGGGTGLLLAAVLGAHRHLHGVLVEAPHVLERAAVVLAEAGVADRCQLVDASFFDSVPPGADAYVLSRVLHDWDDERAVEILRQVRRAIPAHGRLLVVEMLVPEGNAAHFAKHMDIIMMVMTGGQERTGEELAALLAQGGFRLSRVVPTAVLESITEAVPI